MADPIPLLLTLRLPDGTKMFMPDGDASGVDGMGGVAVLGFLKSLKLSVDKIIARKRVCGAR